MSNGPIKALADLWQLYAAEPISAPIEAAFASLGTDTLLASAVRRIVDDGDTADPLAEDLAARVVAAGR